MTMNQFDLPSAPVSCDVTADALIAAERAERYKVQLDRPDVFPAEQNWEYIIECRMGAIAAHLYRKYLVSWITDPELRTDYHQSALRNFPKYLGVIDRRVAVDTVYSDVTSAPDAALHLIVECRLFDARRLLALLDGDVAGEDPAPFVVDCMAAYQPEYSAADFSDMNALYKAVRSLAPIGEMREGRTIFGREVRYICPNGHSNPADHEFCDTCGVNQYGLNEEQMQCLDAFKTRLSLLSKMLK